MDLKPAVLRQRLRHVLKSDSDFNAFLLDYFKKEVHDRLTYGSADRVAKENLLIEQIRLDEIGAALDHWEAAKQAGPGTPHYSQPLELPGDHRHDTLLCRIVETCRVRERLREHLQLRPFSIAGARLRLVEVSYNNLGFLARYGLGATDLPVDTELVTRFSHALKAAFLDLNSTSLATLVYVGEPPTAEAMAAARRGYIALLSLDDYEMLLNLRPSIDRQTQRLLRDPRYPCTLYVPQRARYSLGTSFRFDEQADPALEAVREWLHEPYARFVLILGDFGVGKTFLLYELARRLGEEKGLLLPLLCELRTIEKAQTLDGLLAQHMQQHGIEPIDPQALRHMLSIGKLVLFFDGFDELVLRTSYERAAEHLETLLEAVSYQAKVVVTSRTQHFINDQQIKTVLTQRLERVPCYTVRLMTFEPPQILGYLRNKLKDEAAAQRRYDLIDRVKDLLGLSHNPRMLGFIAELEEGDLLAASLRQGNISAAGLYQLIVNQWLEHEIRRISHRVASRSLNARELLGVVTRLATRLWCQTEKTVSLGDMEETMRGTLEDLASGVHQLGSASLLVRDELGHFSFLHQSVLEWLVAAEVAEKIRVDPLAKVLGEQEMTDLMAEFLIGLLGLDADGMPVAADWVGQVLASQVADAAAEVRKQNALRLLRRMEPAALDLKELSIDLSGQNLRGKDFMGQNLQGASLAAADLTEALLVQSTLEEADLERAILVRADLRGANLRGANLRSANVTDANLMDADLRGADLFNVIWLRTKLVGALLDPEAKAHLEKQTTIHVAGPLVSKVDTRLERTVEDQRLRIAWTDAKISIFTQSGNLLAIDPQTLLPPQKATNLRKATFEQAKISGNGLRIAISDKTYIQILDMQSEQVVSLFKIKPDPSFEEFKMMKNLDKLERMSVLGQLYGHLSDLVISPDGQYMARTLYASWLQTDPDDDDDEDDEYTSQSFSEFLIQETESGRVILKHWSSYVGSISCVGFSSDNRRVVWMDTSGQMHVMDIASPDNRWLISVGEEKTTSVAIHPEGRHVAIACAGTGVQVWDIFSQQKISQEVEMDIGRSRLLFSSNGRFVAALGSTNGVCLWRFEGGQLIRLIAITISSEHTIIDAAFSPDGQTLAVVTSGHMIEFWDVLAQRRRATLLCADGEWISFAPDGRYKSIGNTSQNRFWHVIGGCKFAPGELAEHLPGLCLENDESYFNLPRWSPLDASMRTATASPRI